MTTTFLADAARDGAKIITGIYADRVITSAHTQDATAVDGHAADEHTDGNAASASTSQLHDRSNHAEHAAAARKQQAEGVVAYVGSGKDRVKCVFRAPIVVSSAGSINSPALLLRSSITVNGNVGKNLRLHPAATAPAVFSEKEHGKINMWQGPMMTAYSPDAPDWDGGGYGPMVSTPPVSLSCLSCVGLLTFSDLHVGIFSDLHVRLLQSRQSEDGSRCVCHCSDKSFIISMFCCLCPATDAVYTTSFFFAWSISAIRLLLLVV